MQVGLYNSQSVAFRYARPDQCTKTIHTRTYPRRPFGARATFLIAKYTCKAPRDGGRRGGYHQGGTSFSLLCWGIHQGCNREKMEVPTLRPPFLSITWRSPKNSSGGGNKKMRKKGSFSLTLMAISQGRNREKIPPRKVLSSRLADRARPRRPFGPRPGI